MKKSLYIIGILAALVGTANADETAPYVGIDGGYNITKPSHNENKDYKKLNLGLDVGTKFDINTEYFVGAEGYARLGELIDTANVRLNNNYGVKGYVGYNFGNSFGSFLSYGLNYMRLEANNLAPKTKFASSFGLGVEYAINPDVEAKLTYDYYLYSSRGADIDVHNLRVGLNYLF